MLTQDEYQRIINQIGNEEVPSLLLSTLSKTYGYLESLVDGMDDNGLCNYMIF